MIQRISVSTLCEVGRCSCLHCCARSYLQIISPVEVIEGSFQSTMVLKKEQFYWFVHSRYWCSNNLDDGPQLGNLVKPKELSHLKSATSVHPILTPRIENFV